MPYYYYYQYFNWPPFQSYFRLRWSPKVNLSSCSNSREKSKNVLDRETYQPRWTTQTFLVLHPDLNSGTAALDPDSAYPDHHQNLNNWSLVHAPSIQQLSSKSVHNLQRYTAKSQFTPCLLMVKNPGKWSTKESVSTPKSNWFLCQPHVKDFVKIRS